MVFLLLSENSVCFEAQSLEKHLISMKRSGQWKKWSCRTFRWLKSWIALITVVFKIQLILGRSQSDLAGLGFKLFFVISLRSDSIEPYSESKAINIISWTTSKRWYFFRQVSPLVLVILIVHLYHWYSHLYSMSNWSIFIPHREHRFIWILLYLLIIFVHWDALEA